jgi:hypothetical protein
MAHEGTTTSQPGITSHYFGLLKLDPFYGTVMVSSNYAHGRSFCGIVAQLISLLTRSKTANTDVELVALP